jgi:predicted Zn finger-like uncharacterized protein
MLIVCPSCATSYTIDPAAVGPAGRGVRCVRCKTTWFAGGPAQTPDAAADTMAENAEAQSTGMIRPDRLPRPIENAAAPDGAPTAPDDFGSEPSEPISESSQTIVDRDIASPPVEPAAPQSDPAPSENLTTGPVTISDAPSLVPPIEHAPLPNATGAESDADEIETFAARRQRLKMRRQQSRRSSRWTAIILVLFAFNVALVGARNEVVRYLPQTASLFAAIGLPVNLRNLKFENVRISKEGQDAAAMLIIEGRIVSNSRKPIEVPRLRFAARNATGQEVYTWTAMPSRSILGPGESIEFSSRLASPPADANDVMVRFFSPQDAIAGVK